MSEIKTWHEMWLENKKQYGTGASSQLSFAEKEITELRAALADRDARADRIKGQILELLQALYDTEGMRQTATGAPAILLDDAVCAVEEAIDAMREGGAK